MNESLPTRFRLAVVIGLRTPCLLASAKARRKSNKQFREERSVLQHAQRLESRRPADEGFGETQLQFMALDQRGKSPAPGLRRKCPVEGAGQPRQIDVFHDSVGRHRQGCDRAPIGEIGRTLDAAGTARNPAEANPETARHRLEKHLVGGGQSPGKDRHLHLRRRQAAAPIADGVAEPILPR